MLLPHVSVKRCTCDVTWNRSILGLAQARPNNLQSISALRRKGLPHRFIIIRQQYGQFNCNNGIVSNAKPSLIMYVDTYDHLFVINVRVVTLSPPLPETSLSLTPSAIPVPYIAAANGRLPDGHMIEGARTSPLFRPLFVDFLFFIRFYAKCIAGGPVIIHY